MPLDPQWALQFRDAITTNNIQQAAELLSQCDDSPNLGETPEENDLWSLVDLAISQVRVEILEAVVTKFKHNPINGRHVAKYCLYQSFRDGQMECAQALQVFFPGEVFFCLPHAVKYDQLHMLEHFLPNFHADATDLTRLLFVAWQDNSEQCFDYLVTKCPHLDEKVVTQFCTPIQSVEFTRYVCAQRQKNVLLNEIPDDRVPRNRKM
jgi:hypothetical protein